MARWGIVLGLVASLALLTACKSDQKDKRDGHQAGMGSESRHASMWENVDEAVAVIHPTQGHSAHGIVRFKQVDNAVRIIADIEGLQPNSKHGFHVHEFGDCSATDASSAGGHYNPEGHKHAGPQTAVRHAGDFGNLLADQSGRAHLELTARNLTIAGLKNPIIGRAVIVHEKADDLSSQPTGDAGGRIGCGIIGLANKSAR